MGVTISYLMIYIAEAVIAWLYCRQLFPSKQKSYVTALTLAAGYLILFFMMGLQNVVLNSALFFLINAVWIFLNYCVTAQQAALHAVFLTSGMIFTEMLTVWLVNGFTSGWLNHTLEISVLLSVAIPSKLLYLIATVIAAHWFPSEKANNKNRKVILTLCLLPVSSIVVSCMATNIAFHSDMSGPVRQFLLLIVLTILPINLIYVVLYYQLQSINEKQMELSLGFQREQADLAYYQALQEQAEQQRAMAHDIKNHLQVLHGIAQQTNSAEIAGYIEKLEGSLVSIRKSRFCTDPILNLILLKADENCQKKKIRFHCDVRENCLTALDAPSITTLFSNILSNAIEAVETSSERMIEFSVLRKEEQGNVLISVENSCDLPPLTNGRGELISRKADKKIHGLGIKSINRVLKQYKGESTFYYDAANKRFHYIILLPDTRIGSRRI